MQQNLASICMVLRQKRYAAISAAAGAGLGAAYYWLTMPLLGTHLAADVGIGAWHVAASVGLTALISALGGINVGLVAFKMASQRKAGVRRAGSSVFGGALAAFTPGCPACTAPLAVMLGAVGGLAVLPLQGLELKIASAGALAFSVYWVSRGLHRPSCCSISG